MMPRKRMMMDLWPGTIP